ncbi:MAG: ORF6N domain-containing protein [Mariniphaga sp.]|nr:ORF6N domain-containing protein [Mariniphaga sp.]
MIDKSIQKYQQNIINLIFSIRGKQVMLDEHLADLYDIETKYLNRAVKRNPDRFPKSFMFQLTKKEYESLRFQNGTSTNDVLRFQNGTLEGGEALRFQIGTSKQRGGRRYMPYVFTEQGVSMLSAVLNTETAIKMSVVIMDAFVQMRQFLLENASLLNRIQNIETKQMDTESKVQILLNAMEKQLIDKTEVYHIGASLKDLGKKWFAFSKMEKDSVVIFEKLGI